MAKVRMPLIASASGKVGDTVFRTRWGETILSVRAIPANPRTYLQQLVRHNLSALSQAWKGEGNMVLTDADGSITGTAGTKYVVLWKYDPNQNVHTEVVFAVLSATEIEAWINYAKSLGKPMAYGRYYFVGENSSRLRNNLDPIRTPA